MEIIPQRFEEEIRSSMNQKRQTIDFAMIIPHNSEIAGRQFRNFNL